MRIFAVAIVAFLLATTVLPAAASVDETEKWFLTSRHGECAEVSALQRKTHDLGKSKDPQAFIALMQEKGDEVIVADRYATEGEELRGIAFTVKVPAKGLSLIFVKGVLCNQFIDKE